MASYSAVRKTFREKLSDTPPVRLIVVSFFLLILIGTFLLMMPLTSKSGEFTNPVNAFFTATSATCVTGLVVYDTYTYWNELGQAIILLLIQTGGLGLATFVTGFSLIVKRKLGLKNMMILSESSGGEMPDIVSVLKIMLGFTFACEAVGALILMIRFVPMFGTDGIWPACFIAVSAYCNAGFDILGFIPGNSSLSTFAADPLVSLTVSLLIIIGGLGFVVVQNIYESKIRPAFQKTTATRLNFNAQICLRMSLVLLLLGTISFYCLEFNGVLADLNPLEKLNAAFFHSANTRTAGFSSVDTQSQDPLTKIITLMLMFIGGSPGSTAGGIKVTTFAVLAITVVSSIRGDKEAAILRHKFQATTVYRSLTVAVLAIFLICADTMALSMLNPEIQMIDLAYESASAFGTVGLSANVTSKLESISKLILAVTMFIGRVGPITFSLSLIARHRKKGETVLPEGRMLIG